MLGTLLDTHAFIWLLSRNGKVPKRVREHVLSTPKTVYVSLTSIWEIAIKVGIGRLPEMQPYLPKIEAIIDEMGFKILPIESHHAIAVANLPRHHADPFDRMLIAQAQEERLTLITNDLAFSAYDIKLLW